MIRGPDNCPDLIDLESKQEKFCCKVNGFRNESDLTLSRPLADGTDAAHDDDGDSSDGAACCRSAASRAGHAARARGPERYLRCVFISSTFSFVFIGLDLSLMTSLFTCLHETENPVKACFCIQQNFIKSNFNTIAVKPQSFCFVFSSVSPPSGMQAQAAAAAAAHLGPPPGGAGQPHSHPAPTHMAPHHQPTPPHSQPSQHMNSQGAAGGGHPAPSPVQHQVTPGHPPPPQQAGQQVHTHPGPGQGHPASSGTPQPHLIYQQHGVPMSQQGHPPLQPSPHTPTSPQSMYPQTFVAASPFYATSQAPGMPQQQQQQQQQQQNAQQQQQQQPPGGGGPQLSSFTHTTPHTSVTHAHHQQQHSHMPHHGGGAPSQAPTGPQIVMMPHNAHPSHQQAVGNPGQLQHPQHASLQHTHQIPHHMAGTATGSKMLDSVGLENSPLNKTTTQIRLVSQQISARFMACFAGMQGQAGHMIQQQAMGVPSANNLPHAQMHYQMHHHPQSKSLTSVNHRRQIFNKHSQNHKFCASEHCKIRFDFPFSLVHCL